MVGRVFGAGGAILVIAVTWCAAVGAFPLISSSHHLGTPTSPGALAGPLHTGPLGIGPLVSSITVGTTPFGAAYDSGKGEIFVTNEGQNTVSVISDTTDAVVATVGVGSQPIGVVYDAAKGEVYVVNHGNANVSVIADSNNTVVANIQVGTSGSYYPQAAAYDNKTGSIYIANTPPFSVTVINDTNNTVLTTVGAGGNPGFSPNGMSYDYGMGEIFVPSYNDGTVDVIAGATNTVVATVHVGDQNTQPIAVAYDNGSGEVYVADYSTANVTVISDATSTTTASIGVGSGPDGATFDSATGELYVANAGSNNVSVIRTATHSVVATVNVGHYPQGMAYDSGTGQIFVVNTNSNNVSVITPGGGGVPPPPYAVTFTESGLPSGTNWGVTENGTAMTSTTSSIVFMNGNGSFAYSIGTVSGYTPSPTNGFVLVNGGPTPVAITFTPSVTATYSVTFDESGLTAGTSWSVTLNGSLMSSTTSSVVFTEPNGTYAFTVGSVTGYNAASPASGTSTVNGGPASTPVVFTASSAATFAVTFQQSGLASGTSWSVTLHAQTLSSTTSSIVFSEPNGTFSFSVGAVAGFTATPASGSVSVTGAAVSKTISFSATAAATFAVNFQETGLASGVNWSVTVDGVTHYSTGPAVTFQEPNGSHSYQVGAVSGYSVASSSGTITVAGGTVSKPVTFTASSSSPSTTSGGLSTADYLVIAAVLAVLAIASAVVLLRRKGKSPPTSPEGTSPPGGK